MVVRWVVINSLPELTVFSSATSPKPIKLFGD